MTSSLVGSEMCIRDRPTSLRPGLYHNDQHELGSAYRGSEFNSMKTVSYTHLTLPTSVDLGGR
eukprot:10586900-Prorocentrum_lima.AAC.1